MIFNQQRFGTNTTFPPRTSYTTSVDICAMLPITAPSSWATNARHPTEKWLPGSRKYIISSIQRSTSVPPSNLSVTAGTEKKFKAVKL